MREYKIVPIRIGHGKLIYSVLYRKIYFGFLPGLWYNLDDYYADSYEAAERMIDDHYGK